MALEAKSYHVDFPTLYIVPAWIQRHCIIADGFRQGRPFKMYDWQLWVTLNHYRIKPEAVQTLLPNGRGPVYLFRNNGRIEYRDAQGRVLPLSPR